MKIEKYISSNNFGTKYYITNGRYDDGCEYLHKDRTWQCYCGMENMFDSEAEAEAMAFATDFISEDEMEIC